MKCRNPGMKIIIDARLYGLENAGLGRYAMNLIKHLALVDKQNEYLIILRKKYFQAEPDPALQENQLNFPANFHQILFDFRHYSLTEQIYLPRLLHKYEPDLVHFPHFNVPIFYRGKFVVTIHDMLMHQYRGLESSTLIPPLYLVKRMAYLAAFNHAVKNSSKIIVPSNYIKQELLNSYKIPENKVKVIYEGVGGGYADKTNNVETLEKYKIAYKYFIYVGNAYPHKNLKQAIEAIIYLNKKSIQKTLLLIASSRDVFVKRLEVYIKDKEAQKFVRLLGFVSDKDLASLYKNSQAFLFPSLSEGFGLTGLEAMASGTLVLASDIPVFKEIYQDKAFYFNPHQVESIAQSLETALSLTTRARNKLITEGRQFAKRYSWEKMAKETLRVYEEI